MTDSAPDPILDATTALVPLLMSALDALGYVGRHLHPPDLQDLANALEGFDERLNAARTRFDAVQWPEELGFFKGQVLRSADAATAALTGFAASARDPNGVMRAYRAM
ncbi:MAG: hypothetical protein HC809_11030, partial [Gammaproteobacteria bacterium]|nr:hypothetical protein [Gammaproteobacteria bacterium]